MIKNLYKYRELLKTNIKKEIRGKYKGAWLGVIWSYLNPLLMLVIYSFVFTTIMKIEIPNYTMFLFTALIPWTFFTSAISQGSLSVISNGALLKKVYFPREIIPISVVTSNLVNFFISCLIMAVFILFTGLGFTYHLIYFPLIVLLQYILLLGVTFITSAITVFARDLEHIISVIIMALFYATPIVYSMDMVPESIKPLISANPMATIIQSYRDILFYHQTPDMSAVLQMFGISLVTLMLGWLLFNKLQKNFVEEL